MSELITDSFAGGGGASLGILLATGRSPDIAINHDDEALAMHEANHPITLHLSKNIWKVDPLDYVGKRKVGLAWFSPDCKHFSKAKGGKPVARNIRDLAWVVVLWAKRVRPRVIALENVEEFRHWGPLTAEDMPCPDRKGHTFKRWCSELKKLGYRVEWREIRACDFGAPTIRKRLFLIARCDGIPIVWPDASHGAPNSADVLSGHKLPWRTAAQCIDWTLPCPSIFLTKEEGRAQGCNRPLAEATMARIAKGIKRYVIDAAEPFIVNLTHQGGDRTEGLSDPFKTITGAHRGEKALIVPTIVGCGGRAGQSRPRSTDEPLATITAKGDSCLVVPLLSYGQHGGASREADSPAHTITASKKDTNQLVTAFLAQHNLGVVGHDLRKPVSTITQTGSQQQLVAAHLLHMKGSAQRMRGMDEPVPAVTAQGNHIAEVRAFLLKYYGTDQDPRLDEPLHTVTTKERFGLVMVHGEPYEIVDIGMRMLSPRELFRAQGFPDSYKIDTGADGRRMTKSSQVRMCGNSCSPVVVAAIIAANYQQNNLAEAA